MHSFIKQILHINRFNDDYNCNDDTDDHVNDDYNCNDDTNDYSNDDHYYLFIYSINL